MEIYKRRMIFTVLLVIIALSSGISGCNKKNTKIMPQNRTDLVLPVKEPITLKYWVKNNASSSIKNYSEMGMYKELEKRTGIRIEFIHPAANQQSEQMNIMLASRNLPDMIEGLQGYPGGILKAHLDGIIIELNEVQSKYAPNLQKLYKTYPEIDAQAQNDKGRYFVTPLIRGGAELRTYAGPILRKDWLDELGLGVPTTLDEWYTVLKAFKDKKGIRAPLSSEITMFKKEPFVGAFGIRNDDFVEDGKVFTGGYDPRYKEYMKTMVAWYREGLIDPEIGLVTPNILETKILSGDVGAYIQAIGSGIGRIMSQMKDKNPHFDLVAAPYPTINKGDKAKFVQLDPLVSTNTAVSITTANKYPAETMAWLDYMYSKDGHMLCNFGIENESYVIENKYPKYTELITNNPEGLAMSLVGLKYCRSFISGPFVQDTRYVEQFYSMPSQRRASELWAAQAKEVKDFNVYGTLTPEELEAIAYKTSETTGYIKEMYIKWLTGVESLDKFDEYRDQLKQLGIEDVIKVKQQAYNRFKQRFPQILEHNNNNVSDYYWK